MGGGSSTPAEPPPPPPPSDSPTPTSSPTPSPSESIVRMWDGFILPTRWYCPSETGLVQLVKRDSQRNIACLATNGANCLTIPKGSTCEEFVAATDPYANPLRCGAMHLAVWGATGYDNPTHWCSRANLLIPDFSNTATGSGSGSPSPSPSPSHSFSPSGSASPSDSPSDSASPSYSISPSPSHIESHSVRNTVADRLWITLCNSHWNTKCYLQSVPFCLTLAEWFRFCQSISSSFRSCKRPASSASTSSQSESCKSSPVGKSPG